MSTRNALQIRAAVLSHYGEVAKRLGLNPPLMLRKVGLTTRMLASPAQLIPLASALSLLEISAKESGCGTFGLFLDSLPADPARHGKVIASLTTNHTYFNREPHHYEHFAHDVRPGLLEVLRAGQRRHQHGGSHIQPGEDALKR